MNPFGHIDLRVPDLKAILPFYEKLLPALGFSRTFHSEQWKVFAAEGELPGAAYFAITEDLKASLGVEQCLSKPFSPKELLKTIQDILHERAVALNG